MSGSEYPRFRVVTGIINCDGRHDDYDDVMNDVYVAKTGRYRLLTEPKLLTDPKTGWVTAIVDVIDNGPEDDRPPSF